jgi:Bacterial capsule synthesis protein PGA_cap
VLGHGPHVPRAIELYKGKLIAYSLGNFIGYRTLSTVGNLGESLVLEVKLDAQGNFMTGKIIPVQLDRRGIPYPDRGYGSVQLIRNLNKLDFPNSPLKIDSKGNLSKIGNR